MYESRSGLGKASMYEEFVRPLSSGKRFVVSNLETISLIAGCCRVGDSGR